MLSARDKEAWPWIAKLGLSPKEAEWAKRLACMLAQEGMDLIALRPLHLRPIVVPAAFAEAMEFVNKEAELEQQATNQQPPPG